MKKLLDHFWSHLDQRSIGRWENAANSGSRIRATAKGGDQALLNLEQRLARLDQRIQRMETVVTDRAFDWDRRFRKG